MKMTVMLLAMVVTIVSVAEAGVDAAVLAIPIPRDTVEFDTTHTPVARVVCWGDVPDVFWVFFMIEDICDPDPYYKESTHVMIGSNDSLDVAFSPAWRPRYPSLHRAWAWVHVEGDTNPANDTLRQFFHVRRGVGIEERRAPEPAGFSVAPAVGNLFHFESVTGQELVVYDASGSRVREFECPRGSLTWDGSDARGKRLAAGPYFARQAGRIVRLLLLR